MKESPLLLVQMLYLAADVEDVQQYVDSVAKAFEFVAPDRSVSDLAQYPDPWRRVQFSVVTSKKEWDALPVNEADAATLYVVIVTDALVKESSTKEVLDSIAARLPKRVEEGNSDLLSYSLSEQAIGKLPPVFSKRQVQPMATLGERKIAPHKLGLIALHRARLLLGEMRDSTKLRMFISHAKSDGVFLAQSIKNSISEVPGLKEWYDATSIENGSDWLDQIEAAAEESVFIAVRTNAYDQRKICRDEFMAALHHGVPIVVVDALMQPLSDPSPLPFAAVPTVRVPDGNTYRILRAVLREHVKLLLMRAVVREVSPPTMKTLVWPRMPTPGVINRVANERPDLHYLLVPSASTHERELLDLRDWLKFAQDWSEQSSGSKKVPRMELVYLEQFSPPPTLS